MSSNETSRSRACHHPVNTRLVIQRNGTSARNRPEVFHVIGSIMPPKQESTIPANVIEDIIEPLSMHTIYMEKLFTNGDGSNFTIVIKSDSFKDEPKTMKLHKNFLCQMSYFQALFGAQWAETDREMMEINLTDANISQKSIDIVFKSLYTGKLVYQKTEDDLISIMATARFFALDSVADTIATVMQNIVNVENAVYFYYSFRSYGYPVLEDYIFHWILRHFGYWNNTNHEIFCSKVLSHIEEEFMEKLVKNDNLIVKNEMDLYNILKRWMVDKMKLRADYDYFKMWSRPEPFLETEEGKEYEKIFSLLNLEQLCRHTGNIDQLKKDNILPTSWIHRACADSYMRLMKLSNISSQNFSLSTAFSCRLAIFHTNFTTFKAATVDFCGVHLKFTWVQCCLVVTRHQPLKSLSYNGSITIAFRYNFHTPGEFSTRESGTKVIEFNHGASFELASSHAKLVVDPADPKKVMILELFPKIISIHMELKKL